MDKMNKDYFEADTWREAIKGFKSPDAETEEMARRFAKFADKELADIKKGYIFTPIMTNYSTQSSFVALGLPRVTGLTKIKGEPFVVEPLHLFMGAVMSILDKGRGAFKQDGKEDEYDVALAALFATLADNLEKKHGR